MREVIWIYLIGDLLKTTILKMTTKRLSILAFFMASILMLGMNRLSLGEGGVTVTLSGPRTSCSGPPAPFVYVIAMTLDWLQPLCEPAFLLRNAEDLSAKHSAPVFSHTFLSAPGCCRSCLRGFIDVVRHFCPSDTGRLINIKTTLLAGWS